MCDCLPTTPIPPAVQVLAGTAKLLFTATYNVKDFYVDAVSVNIGLLPNSTSVMNVPFTLFKATPTSQEFIHEDYQLTTYSSDLSKQYGYIGAVNSYPSSTEITTEPVVKFAIAAKNGLYKCVTELIIDYTNEVRVMYFFQKKRK